MISIVLREKLNGTNLSALSREIGVTKQQLHSWVHGKVTPSLKNAEQLRQLARHLGLTIEELLFGEEASSLISSITFTDDGKTYELTIKKLFPRGKK